MTIPTFDNAAIRDLSTDTSYYRGEDYYEGGTVRNLVLEGETYRAYVYG